MAERSCANCKYVYVDDLYYEWCCRLKKYPDLDDQGDPVDNTKCKKMGEGRLKYAKKRF